MSNCKRYTEAELQQFLSDGIAELQQEIKELHKDKARLDWLADANNNIRDAIDEAMLIELTRS